MQAVYKEKPKYDLSDIRRIISIRKKERTMSDQETLINYLKKLKIFKDMLKDEQEDYDMLSGCL